MTGRRRAVSKQQAAKKTLEVYRRQIFKLCNMRFGNHFVRDSDDGRALLTALLCCLLGDDVAMQAAPWLERDDLQAMRRNARRLRPRQIGPLLGVTDAERKLGKLWLLRPCDKPWREVQREASERRDKADRERKRRKRLEQREERLMMQRTNKRDDAIMRMLTTDWIPVSALVREAGDCRAFRRPDGRLIRPNGLRKLVHRTLKMLAEHGAVETILRKGPHGLVCLARKIDTEGGLSADAFWDGDSVTAVPDGRERPKTDSESNASTVTKSVRTKPPERVRSNNIPADTPLESATLSIAAPPCGCPSRLFLGAVALTKARNKRPYH